MLKVPEPKDRMIRVTVYISSSTYRRLKAVLAIEGKTVSGWFRDQAKELGDTLDE
jgi:hypothetical protein